MEEAWPEAHQKYRELYALVNEQGALDARTKAFIGLAAASLYYGHIVDHMEGRPCRR